MLILLFVAGFFFRTQGHILKFLRKAVQNFVFIIETLDHSKSKASLPESRQAPSLGEL